MDSQKEMTKAIKHAGRYMKKEQDKIMPPDEFCPECLSLKRKPNEECLNHNKYWINSEDYLKGNLDSMVGDLSALMVKNIANKLIKVEDTYEGKRHQRHWYLEAQKMLRKLIMEYRKACKEAYNK